jgi:hypothetical protein
VRREPKMKIEVIIIAMVSKRELSSMALSARVINTIPVWKVVFLVPKC